MFLCWRRRFVLMYRHQDIFFSQILLTQPTWAFLGDTIYGSGENSQNNPANDPKMSFASDKAKLPLKTSLK